MYRFLFHRSQNTNRLGTRLRVVYFTVVITFVYVSSSSQGRIFRILDSKFVELFNKWYQDQCWRLVSRSTFVRIVSCDQDFGQQKVWF